MQFTTELVGWFEDGFKDSAPVLYDENTVNDINGVTFGGSGTSLRKLSIASDTHRIYNVTAEFSEAVPGSPRTVPGTATTNQTEFIFTEGEYIAKLRFFLSFGATEITRTSVKGSMKPAAGATTSSLASQQEILLPRTADIESATAAARKGQSDWGFAKAQLRKHYSKHHTKSTLDLGTALESSSNATQSTASPSKPYPFSTHTTIATGFERICGIGFLFEKKDIVVSEAPKQGFIKRVSNLVKGTVQSGKAFVQKTRLRIFNAIPSFVIVILWFIQSIAIHVVLPIYDIISDFLSAYYYFNDRRVLIVSALILGFIVLPHAVQSTFLIWEMIVDMGEFDEYPRALVRFYKSTPTPYTRLNHVLKFLTLPLFIVLNFVWFFLFMFYFVLTRIVILLASLGLFFVRRLTGATPPEQLRRENIRDDAWSKSVLIELFFETVPQVITQAAALITLYNQDDNLLRNFPVMSSIIVSLLNFVSQSWILSGFMRIATLSFVNLCRIMLSSALDFFPIFGLYRDTMDSAVFQFFDNPILLEIWKPLRAILMRNRNLKAVTLILEDTKDWMDMSSQLLDSIEKNEQIDLKKLEVNIDEIDKDRIARVQSRMEPFKEKFHRLIKARKTKKIYVFADAILDMGVVDKPIEEAEVTSVEKDGVKYSWDWPDERSSRVRYCIELPESTESSPQPSTIPTNA